MCHCIVHSSGTDYKALQGYSAEEIPNDADNARPIPPAVLRLYIDFPPLHVRSLFVIIGLLQPGRQGFLMLGRHGYSVFATSSGSHGWNFAYCGSGVMLKWFIYYLT